MASILKKLLAVLHFGGLVGVVAYAMVKPEATPEGRDRPGAKGGASAAGGGPPVVPVLAARAELQSVPVLVDAVGTVRPLNIVTVKPQVDGRILKIGFKEGQDVKAGDLIAELDPASYQAALDQAIARREITATQLANARRDYDRMAKIPNVMAQKTMDTQEAQVEQLEAQLKADDAAIASARTTLGYTRITSPIDGRTGLRQIDEGNLVRSAGDAGIVTITEIDPIALVFSLPQQRLREVQRAERQGTVAVEAMDADGQRVVATGTLEVIDNQIDAATGTIRMKARFPNAGRLLWPGQFINVRVKVDTLDSVVTVPTAAVQRGPAGTFVWVVDGESKAKVRPVETGLTTEVVAVVAKGVEPGEQVVTTGFARISEGARLVVRDAPAAAPVAFAPPAKARGGKGGNRGEKGKRRREGEAAQSGSGSGATGTAAPASAAPASAATATTPAAGGGNRTGATP
ncbi:MAG: efflux RND transporter periplasmic adaptor subunit [Hyphomicrobiaceae bacterium]